MIDLAVAVIIGGAFGKVVSAIVADLIMPLVGALLPSGDWRTYTATSLNLQIGDLLGAVIDFVIVAFVLFIAVVKVMGAVKRPDAKAAPTTKSCPECLETIPLAARRCRACTAVLAAA
jgi:large conductance mechanosensitive channel